MLRNDLLCTHHSSLQVQSPWETIFSSKYSLPSLATWESWKLILGYGSALFATQFTETAIALNVVDLLDKSQGPGFLVLMGQGGANIVSGLMGGMGSSGVVSMSVLADRTFGTSCLSTFLTGAFILAFITWGYPVIDFIPLSAISGISIATVCSFIQWRSIAAMFTTCLPNSARDKLPSQFNIARIDVLIMLIVTAACLIVDVATLLFFAMAVGMFAFESARSYLARRKERKSLDAGAIDIIGNDETASNDNDYPTTPQLEERECEIDEEKDVLEKEEDKEKESNLLTVCTAAIFPHCV
jgi:MFS superfamily sulfate permease-like transporter